MLRVWQDANQDGVSSSTELKSLSDYGISAIGLTRKMTGHAIEGADDNVIYATSDVVHADGSITTAGDVFLSYDSQQHNLTIAMPYLNSTGTLPARRAPNRSHPIPV